jgi:hypothetical protein
VKGLEGEQRKMLREAVSDLLGGIGYYYGSIQVKQEDGTIKESGKCTFIRKFRALSFVHWLPIKEWIPTRVPLG